MTLISDGGDNDLPSVLNSYLLETGEHHQYLVSPNILTILPKTLNRGKHFVPQLSLLKSRILSFNPVLQVQVHRSE